MSGTHLLGFVARHAKLVLAGGLALGIALPEFAALLSGWIPEMIVALLFLGALRLSPSDLRDLGTNIPTVAAHILCLQLLLPLALLALAFASGQSYSLWALALVLLAAAPPIVSSPNIAAIMGLSQTTAMQYMVAGSLLLPLTTLPVFWLIPALGSSTAILVAVLRLLLTIALAGGGAIALRHLLPRATPRALQNLDGTSVLALTVFVIALMPAVSGAIANDPTEFAFWLVIAFAANFGAQIIALRLGRSNLPAPENGAIALVAGNRNISLFFVALPHDVTEPLLVFLGCYQLPMLLTPLLLSRLYARQS